MIETWIAIFAGLGILVIALAKLWNIVSKFEFYPKRIIIIGLVVSIILWGIYLTAALSALNYSNTWVDGSGIDIIQTNTEYQTLFNFMPIVNILFGAIWAMTFIEGLKYLMDVVNPKSMRQQYGYSPKPPSSEYRQK